MIEPTAIYVTLDYLNDSLGALNVKLGNIKDELNAKPTTAKTAT